jgi:hypothetical protein
MYDPMMIRTSMPQKSWASHRYNEMVVMTECPGKDFRMIVLTGQAIYAVNVMDRQNKFTESLVRLTCIESIDTDENPVDTFDDEDLNMRSEHVMITWRSCHGHGCINLFTFEPVSYLLYHLRAAWQGVKVAEVRGIPPPLIVLEHEVHKYTKLYDQLEQELSSFKGLGAEEVAAKHELLDELCDAAGYNSVVKKAALRSRRLPGLLFDDMVALGCPVRIGRGLVEQTRHKDLAYLAAVFEALEACLFNAQGIEERLRILSPLEFSFEALVHAISHDFSGDSVAEGPAGGDGDQDGGDRGALGAEKRLLLTDGRGGGARGLNHSLSRTVDRTALGAAADDGSDDGEGLGGSASIGAGGLNASRAATLRRSRRPVDHGAYDSQAGSSHAAAVPMSSSMSMRDGQLVLARAADAVGQEYLSGLVGPLRKVRAAQVIQLHVGGRPHCTIGGTPLPLQYY